MRLADETLLSLAFYAPQWATHVEAALGWPGLEEAVWWIHAHTMDRRWSVQEEVRQKWHAAIRQRTPLAMEDLLEGAVDVAWFGRVSSGGAPGKRGSIVRSAAIPALEGRSPPAHLTSTSYWIGEACK